MAKLPSTIFNMVMTLVIVSLLSGGSLALMNEATKEPIRQALYQKQLEAIKAVLPEFQNDPVGELANATSEGGQALECYPARDAEGNLLGMAVKSVSPRGYSGDIWLMVGLKADGSLHGAQVLEHHETPGLGTKMADSPFKDQFIGKNPADFDLRVKKDGGQVDAITAATISSRAYGDAIERAYQAFLQQKSAFEAQP